MEGQELHVVRSLRVQTSSLFLMYSQLSRKQPTVDHRALQKICFVAGYNKLANFHLYSLYSN